MTLNLKQYEYLQETYSHYISFEKWLNEYGEKGWRVVNIKWGDNDPLVTFIREVEYV